MKAGLYSWILICAVYQAKLVTVSYEIDSGLCGVRKIVSPLPRIVGGTTSAQSSWPWQVMIMQDEIPECGAVLISTEHILTAAHCIPTNATDYLTFYLGAYKWDATDATAVQVNVNTIVCHEDYDDFSLAFDICLLKLQKPTKFTEYIQPVCLPAPYTRVEVGENVTVTGWGENLELEPVQYLNEAEVLVIETSLCRRWYRKVGVSIPSSHFCAGHREGGIDSCFGDSGGPLVHKVTSTNNISTYVLRGITSFGDGCAEKEKPGVYVRISDLIPWIQETIRALSPEITSARMIELQTTGEASMPAYKVSLQAIAAICVFHMFLCLLH